MYRQMGPDATAAGVTPLPADFLAMLAQAEEVLVSSRDGGGRGTVPVWFIVEPPGVVYLFTFGFSVKACRWRSDPWVRLSLPDRSRSVEIVVRFVGAAEIDDSLAERVVERWSTQGATTVEGLRRTVRDGVHVLVRVESARNQPG